MGSKNLICCACPLNKKGSLLASCSEDGTARLWNVETGALLHVLKGAEDSWIVSGNFSTGGTLFVAESSNPSGIYIWDANTGKPWLLWSVMVFC